MLTLELRNCEGVKEIVKGMTSSALVKLFSYHLQAILDLHAQEKPRKWDGNDHWRMLKFEGGTNARSQQVQLNLPT